MKRDDVKKILGEGASDEAVNAIMDAYGKGVERAKSAADAAKAEADALKAQLAEANTAIEGFKSLKPDELKAAADEWKAKAEQAERDANEKLYSFKFETRLMSKLKDEFSVKNPRRILPDIDRSMLKYDEEKDDIFGNLADQIAPIKEKEPYQFADTTEPPRIVSGGNQLPPQGQSLESAIEAALGIKKIME